MSEPPFKESDRWTDLLERFAARGAYIRVGSIQTDMIEHLRGNFASRMIEVRWRAFVVHRYAAK